LGTDLLNPLWRRVRLLPSGTPPQPCPQPPGAPAAGACGEASAAATTAAGALWRNATYGLVSAARPGPLPQPRGGVLAEEMGLGKTVRFELQLAWRSQSCQVMLA
jgi:hypothetical protein